MSYWTKDDVIVDGGERDNIVDSRPLEGLTRPVTWDGRPGIVLPITFRLNITTIIGLIIRSLQ